MHIERFTICDYNNSIRYIKCERPMAVKIVHMFLYLHVAFKGVCLQMYMTNAEVELACYQYVLIR